jgi:hypothetical protein
MKTTNVNEMTLTDLKWKVWILEGQVEKYEKYNQPAPYDLWTKYIVYRGYLKQLEKNK